MKSITCHESSVLSLLTQCKNLSEYDKRRFLGVLEGRALNIAKVIIGEGAGVSKEIRVAAEGFITLAK